MQVLQSGIKYNIVGGAPLVGQGLPAKVFRVNFSLAEGFFLSELSGLEATGEKVYGPHEQKVDKIIRSFHQFTRNMGVILSGRKGSGKTLVAKMVCQKAQLPVILVNEDYDGLIGFLNSIEQEVIVLFDEFEKVFSEKEDQVPFLSLFDGTSNGIKKLFIITCNSDLDIDQNFFNRPGRVHYHMSFDQLTPAEVKEYLLAEVKPEYRQKISHVVSLLTLIPLNYDCLRAIAFELNLGYAADEALQDLNIDIDPQDISPELVVHFKDGTKISGSLSFDFSDKHLSVWLEDSLGRDVCLAELEKTDFHFVPERQSYLLAKETLIINGYDSQEAEDQWGGKEIDEVELKINPVQVSRRKVFL